MNNYVLIPCAGSGSRFGGEVPKQYTYIGNKTVLEHTLNVFLALAEITTIVVVVNKDDTEIDKYKHLSPKITIARVGGATRGASVLNGLNSIKCEPDDWVLVHDAARCCISAKVVRRLIAAIRDDAIGGILALPVTDTLKMGDDGIIAKTIDRSNIYQAQTPQMFRYSILHKALTYSDLNLITDEASAVEGLGLPVHLIEGAVSNIKLTYPLDTRLAEFYLGA
jgi:2-C-methyl-D-erythritol 4-phosphate cytidylyltransferase